MKQKTRNIIKASILTLTLQRVEFATRIMSKMMSLEKQIVILLLVIFSNLQKRICFSVESSASSRFIYTHFHWFAAAQFVEQPAIESCKLSNYVF
jgi:hypothetical protein